MSDREEQLQEQYERQLHQQNLGSQNGSNAPETLKYVSKPEDIDSPVEALEWINSKSTSTANLEKEDVRSKEFVIEYNRVMSTANIPPSYGITGHLRAVIYDDLDEFKTPLSTGDIVELEGFAEVGKESSTRSKEGWATETVTKDTTESIVRDNNKDSKSKGLLGRIRG
jgi:hypothetical protein